jgi:hypothetical protein
LVLVVLVVQELTQPQLLVEQTAAHLNLFSIQLEAVEEVQQATSKTEALVVQAVVILLAVGLLVRETWDKVLQGLLLLIQEAVAVALVLLQP